MRLWQINDTTLTVIAGEYYQLVSAPVSRHHDKPFAGDIFLAGMLQ